MKPLCSTGRLLFGASCQGQRYSRIFDHSLALLKREHLNTYISQSVQSLSHVRLFATPWTAACQATLSITNSQSLLKLMSIKLVMPSNHFILYCPRLLLPSIFPSIRVFPNDSVLPIRWPKYWSFSFSISPSNEYPELISLRIDQERGPLLTCSCLRIYLLKTQC